MRFLTEIFADDPDLPPYIQRFVGYALTGVTTEQCFWIAYGTGANGKSTLFETLHRHVFGPCAATMPFPSVAWSDAMSEYQKAALVGRRFVSSSEVTRQGRLERFSLVLSTRSWYFCRRGGVDGGCVLDGLARTRVEGFRRGAVVEGARRAVSRQSRVGGCPEPAAAGDGGFAPRPQTKFRSRVLAGQEDRLAALILARPDATLAELRRALPTTAGLSTLWRTIGQLGFTLKKNRTRRRAASA
jgi:hypothetical protein